MGKMTSMLIFLISIDLVFLILGLLSGTLTSMVFEVIANPSVIKTSSYWGQLMGAAGVGAFLSVSLVAVGFLVTKSDSILFAGIGTVLGTLVVDFISIYNILRAYSPVAATLFMVPISMMYVFTAVEWIRGKD